MDELDKDMNGWCGLMRRAARGHRPVSAGGEVALLALALLLAACGRPEPMGPGAAPPQWRALFPGIQECSVTIHGAQALRVHALKIDLRHPGLKFVVTPPPSGGGAMVRSMRVSTFVERFHCLVAINATPFGPEVDREGRPQVVSGLAAADGKVYARPPNNTWGVLLIGRDNGARIATPPVDLAKVWNAVGGFGLLLKDGVNVGAKDARYPRTAVGLSRDGRWMYWLVIDGHQPNFSIGASTWTTARWLQWLGAWQGLNLDGGGSSTLVVADGKEGPVVLNCPINSGIPGTQRPVAVCLGVTEDTAR